MSSSPAQRRTAYLVLGIALVLAPLMVVQVRQALRSNTNDVRDWLPRDYPETKTYDHFRDQFGSEDFIAASWEGCTRTDPRLAAFAQYLRGENPALAQYLQSKHLPPLVSRVTTGGEVYNQLSRSPLRLSDTTIVNRLRGTLIGPDGQQTCAIVTLSNDGRRKLLETIDLLEQAALAAKLPPGALQLGGPPVVNAAMNRESTQSLVRLAVLAMGIGLVIAWRCFHAMRLTIMVFVVGLASAAASIAMVPLCGVPMNAILITMAPLVYVSGMSGAIHLTNYYLDAVKEGREKPVEYAAKHALLPLALAAGTTAVGLLSLEYADLVPIRQFGRFSALGIAISALVQFTILPACLTLWPPPVRRHPDEDDPAPEPSRLDVVFKLLADWVIARRNWLAVGFLLLLTVGGYGLSRVETSIQIIRLFAQGTPILKQYNWLETNLGALVPMEVVVRFDGPTDENDASGNQQNMLGRLELVQLIQRELNELPDVTGSLSAATFAPNVQGQSGGSLASFVLNRQLTVARPRLLESGYLASQANSEFWRVSVRVKAAGDLDYNLFQEQLKGKIEPQIAALGERGIHGISASYTGTVPILYKARRKLMDGMFLGFGTDVLLIVAAAVLVTRHWTNGLLLMLASVFPMTIVFGGMGLLGIVVDIGSVMTPCVALGVTVDDVIHFILWFRKGVERGKSVRDSVLLAYDGCARAMYQSWGVIGLGLSAFALSSFAPTFRFGALMIALLTAGLVGNLVFLPALLAGPLGRWIASAIHRRQKAHARLAPEENLAKASLAS